MRFTPTANANNSNTANGFGFTYKTTDGAIQSTQGGLVTVSVKPVNDAPDAVNDMASATLSTSSQIPVFSNDTDIDGDTLAITNVSTPAHSTTAIYNNGTPNNTGDDQVTYTPANGYVGPDSFNYTISDGQGGGDTASVSVSVTEVNVTWSVTPSYSGSLLVLVYKVKNNSDAILTNVSANIPLYTSTQRTTFTIGSWKETTLSTATTPRYQGVWNGFSLNKDQEATLTLMRNRPTGSNKPVAAPATLTFTTTGNGKTPPPTQAVFTP